jgi:hypothetical protein
MMKSTWPIMFMAILLLAITGVNGGVLFAEEQDKAVLKPASKFKRALKLKLGPYRNVIGTPRTGQTTSYAPGDDGDLQRGMPWPEPRFVEHGDGTVTDKVTGLMWTKDAHQIPTEMNWHDALEACNDLVFAGYHNWRLPNVRELLSLIDYGRHDPALSEGHPFSNVQPSDAYWSGTTSLPHTAQALNIIMTNGAVRRNNKASSLYRVWPVRRGRQHVW